jgi:predicted transcriptional regulator
MNGDQFDLVFATLAHAGRRRMLDLIQAAPGMSVKALTTHFDMSRIAVLKHVRTLEAADLVISKKAGRTRQLFFNPVPIQMIYDRWTDAYSAFWSQRVTDIKNRVEDRAETKDNRSA